jgi:hypothetical protein
MYSNTNNAFTDVTLNTWETTKDKTAASKDYFQLFPGTTTEKVAVQSFLKHIILANTGLGTTAAAGVAGAYQDGTSKRLFAANGLEPQQVLLKGMMGACFMDQIVNNYLK